MIRNKRITNIKDLRANIQNIISQSQDRPSEAMDALVRLKSQNAVISQLIGVSISRECVTYGIVSRRWLDSQVAHVGYGSRFDHTDKNFIISMLDERPSDNHFLLGVQYHEPKMPLDLHRVTSRDTERIIEQTASDVKLFGSNYKKVFGTLVAE